MKEICCFQCKEIKTVTRRQKYCCNACRQKAYRERNNEEASTSKNIQPN